MSAGKSWAHQLPCEARVADGAIRGAGIGLLWGMFYGPGEWRLARSGAVGAAAATRPVLHALQHGGLTTAGFAAFLAGYNGIYCSSERRLGPSAGNALLAGGCMGSLLGAAVSWPVRATSVVSTAVGTALLCAGCQLVWGDPE